MFKWQFSTIFFEICLVMSKLQLNPALANFVLISFSSLVDYSLIKLTNKAFFYLFYIAQTVKFLPDNNTLLNKQQQ